MRLGSTSVGALAVSGFESGFWCRAEGGGCETSGIELSC